MKKTIKASTWLPCFPGFYYSILDNESILMDEIEYINSEYRQDKQSINYDHVDFNYKQYMIDVSESYTEQVENKLVKMGLIKSIKFESVKSPKEYNFRTDEVNCIIEYYPTKLYKFIKEHYEAIKTYIKEKHTSYDGFISFQSNDIENEWLYVFGFATHILSFKAQKPIGKTDIYNVLVAGGYLPTAQTTKHKKIKAKGGKF